VQHAIQVHACKNIRTVRAMLEMREVIPEAKSREARSKEGWWYPMWEARSEKRAETRYGVPYS